MSDAAPIPPILLVGGGRMGGAMLAGWREQGLAQSVVIDPAPAVTTLAAADVSVVPALADLPAGFVPQIVVLAVKPQIAAEIVPAFVRFAGHAAFLSIMAGATLDRLADWLGPRTAIVRAMPNTPAAIRQGMTVACAGPHLRPDQHALCERLLRAVGDFAWVEREALLDPVTAISGGGPAYVFLLAELLESIGVAEGLPAEMARLMARSTLTGAGALLAASPDDSAMLRRAVCSPGGTTERAIDVLMAEDGWPSTLHRAMRAAMVRARELAT